MKATEGSWADGKDIPITAKSCQEAGFSLIYVNRDDKTETDANARLIAAAPDLYRALEAIQKKMEKFIDLANNIGVNDADGFYLGHALEVEKQATEALAKARGEA